MPRRKHTPTAAPDPQPAQPVRSVRLHPLLVKHLAGRPKMGPSMLVPSDIRDGVAYTVTIRHVG